MNTAIFWTILQNVILKNMSKMKGEEKNLQWSQRDPIVDLTPVKNYNQDSFYDLFLCLKQFQNFTLTECIFFLMTKSGNFQATILCMKILSVNAKGTYRLCRGTLTEISFICFSLCYLEIAESVCQFIQGITVKKKEGRKEGDYILRIMTSLCFFIPDPDPPYLCVPYHF